MRAVVQRVSEASVTVGGKVQSAIGGGLLVYLGVDREDGEGDVSYVADKVRHLRIFPDESGKMNHDVVESGGSVLVVSAFTVSADARKGRRPTFETACEPDRARHLYEVLCDTLQGAGVLVQRGSFGEDMRVKSVNAGPICMLLHSRRLF